jgi:hypothetical protein
MTLILSLTNTQNSILVSDRRLTYADGSIKTDEQTKLATWICADGRFGVAFSGLAEYGGLRTESWLLDQLFELGPPDFQAPSMLSRFRQAATDRWRRIKVDNPAAKRTSFVFSGFDHSEDPPRARATKLSNWEGENVVYDQPFDEFAETGIVERRPRREGSDMGAVLVSGMLNVIPDSEIALLARMLERRLTPDVIIDRAVAAIRTASDDPTWGGSIGKQCLSLVVPRDAALEPWSRYHPMEESDVIHAANAITTTSTFQGAIRRAEFQIIAPPLPGSPKVGRNDPCPCGSGKKFKRCHGE